MKKNILITFFNLIWRGNLSLPIQVWLVCILAGKLVDISTQFISRTLGYKEVTVICAAIFIAYYGVAGVGVRRAADKYKGPKIWFYLSKLVALIAILVLALSFINGYLKAVG